MYRDIKNHIKLIIVINKPKKIKMNVANRKTGDWLAQFGFFLYVPYGTWEVLITIIKKCVDRIKMNVGNFIFTVNFFTNEVFRAVSK